MVNKMNEKSTVPASEKPGAWRSLRGNVMAMGWVSLLTDFSSEMMNPLLPIFVAGLVGGVEAALWVGLIEGIAETTASVLKLFSGRISDRLGKRKALVLGGYGLFVITLIQNSFASRIVEIQDRQKVVDTGVYLVVRHPMYAAALTMFFATPVVLGSYYALIPMVFFFTGIIFRIRNEEQVLCKGLDGYESYMKKVKYRLIPFIW